MNEHELIDNNAKALALDKFAAEYEPTEEEIIDGNDLAIKLLKEAEFPWEKALDSYDPTFPNYTPSEQAFNFFNIMRLVKGEDFEVGNSLAQYFIIDVLFDNVTPEMFPYSKEVVEHIQIDNDRIAVCCSRGLAKSTLVTNFLPIYVAITGELPNYGKQKFWLLLGASSRGHARNMAVSIKAVCEASKFMNDAMEYMRFTETEIEFLRKGSGSEESRYFCIRFMGIFTPTRGQKNKFNARPDLALMDDCMPSHAAAYSKAITKNLETAINADLGNALKARGGKIWNIFTPMNYQEPNTASVLNGSFTPVLIPVAANFDPEYVTEGQIVSSWPQEHTSKSIHKMWKLAKASKSMQLFMQERMLRLTSGSDRLVPESCIQWLDMRTIEKNISAYNIYITTDYTTTSGEGSDFSGRATWAVNSNEDWFLLDLRLRKQTMDEQYKDTLQEANKWLRRGRHVEIGVEVDGNQNAHIYSLEKMMLDTSTWATFARQKNNPNPDKKGILSRSTGVKKHERFRIAVNNVLLPKKMWFPLHLKDTPDMQEFISQIRGATHSQFTRADDGPDLITMAVVSMEVVYPSVSVDEDVTTKITPDGLIWSSSFEEDMDELNTGNRSTVF